MAKNTFLSDGSAAPDDLKKGTVIGERFEIIEQLGRSDLAASYLVNPTSQPESPKLTLKILDPKLMDLYRSFQQTLRLAAEAQHKNLSKIMGFGVHDEYPFIALEYVKGQTFKSAIERKEATHSKFSPRNTLQLVTPICQALESIHERIPHGAITPRNIYQEQNGRLCLANLGFGWLMEHALKKSGRGASADSPFIAPEVRNDPAAASPLSDIFSMGMLTICLLAGHHPTQDAASDLAQKLLKVVPESLHELLNETIAEKVYQRPKSIAEFLDRLHNGIEDLRDQIIEKSGPPLLPPPIPGALGTPAIGTPRVQLGRVRELTPLAGLLAVTDLPPVPEDGDDPAVWLIHRDGFDYGPYTSEQVREQLLNDSIDEFTEVRNLETIESGLLIEIPYFTEFVEDYLPLREERRRREALRKAEVQKTVKRASAAGVITIFIGLLTIAAGYVYYMHFMRAAPEQIAFERLLAQIPTDFAPPSSGYVGISADPSLMASLFNFEEEIAEAPDAPRRRRRTGTSRTTNGNDYQQDGPLDYGTVDFTSEGSGRRLTSNDINQTIAREARDIQRCFRQELQTNPNLRRDREVVMRFTIRPDGTPIGVNIDPGNYTDDLRSCLVSIFRSMRFPAHNELALPISYPFPIRS